MAVFCLYAGRMRDGYCLDSCHSDTRSGQLRRFRTLLHLAPAPLWPLRCSASLRVRPHARAHTSELLCSRRYLHPAAPGRRPLDPPHSPARRCSRPRARRCALAPSRGARSPDLAPAAAGFCSPRRLLRPTSRARPRSAPHSAASWPACRLPRTLTSTPSCASASPPPTSRCSGSTSAAGSPRGSARAPPPQPRGRQVAGAPAFGSSRKPAPASHITTARLRRPRHPRRPSSWSRLHRPLCCACVRPHGRPSPSGLLHARTPALPHLRSGQVRAGCSSHARLLDRVGSSACMFSGPGLLPAGSPLPRRLRTLGHCYAASMHPGRLHLRPSASTRRPAPLPPASAARSAPAPPAAGFLVPSGSPPPAAGAGFTPTPASGTRAPAAAASGHWLPWRTRQSSCP